MVAYSICVECGTQARPVTGAVIYPHRPDLHKLIFFQCPCGAYCGAHKRTGRPLGSPAGPRTRVARQKAHRAFDAIWKSKYMSRSKAYRWLADAIGVPHLNCHIALMNREMAERVVKVSRAKLEACKSEALDTSQD